MKENRISNPPQLDGKLLLVLGFLAALDPLAIDMYLPAFPRIGTELSGTPAAVQLTLTAFLLGTAFGQLLFGPLSDGWGRRRLLVVSLAVCVFASIGSAIAPTLTLLTISRFIQGFTASSGIVLGRAIVADVATGKVAVRAFNILAMVAGIAPIVAPVIGGLLMPFIGWRGILWVLAGLTLAAFIAVALAVPETHRRIHEELTDIPGLWSSLVLLKNRRFIGYTIVGCMLMANLMAYLSASPFVFQNLMGFSPSGFGIAIAINSLGLVACSALAARLSYKLNASVMLGWAVVIQLMSTATLLLFIIIDIPILWTLVPMFVMTSSTGLGFGNVTALALAQVPEAAGTASAVFGAAQFFGGALVTPLVGLGGEFAALPMALTIFIGSLVMMIGMRVAHRSPATIAT